MEAYFLDWLNLLGRWVHLITGIAWIGASFYFVWLDNHLVPPVAEDLKQKGVGGELWAVHGGGFYNAQKYKVAPAQLPPHLHWFKWEAYSTLMSGFFLLCLIYYVGADVYLIDKSVADISRSTAILIGLAALAGGWIVYDLLCKTALAKNEFLFALVLCIFLGAAAYGLFHVFSARGAYIHFGAMLGTIMVANVFFVIMPGQRAMVAATAAGLAPDPAPGLKAKLRSVHNTYFTLPVLLTMISTHYAMLYGSRLSWLMLMAMAIAGALIRIFFVSRHKGRPAPIALILGILILLVVSFALAPSGTGQGAASHPAGKTDFAQVQAIVAQRCATCHAAKPSQPGFAVAPKGIMLDTPERIVTYGAQVRLQVASRIMPIGNLTGMTEEERALIAAWDGTAAHP